MKGRKKQISRVKQCESLLNEACNRPGVRELMEVYETWRTFEAQAIQGRQAIAIQKVIALSDSSGPVVRSL